MAKLLIHDKWTDRYPVHGCDVSRWQDGDCGKGREPFVNWDLAAPGQHFVILKVSEQIEDSEYKYNAQKTKEKGLPRGGYHFFRWDLDIQTQVNMFVDLAFRESLELDLFLDVERNPFNPNDEPDTGLYTRLVEQFTRLTFDERKKRLGKEPRPLGYYSRKNYWDMMLAPNKFSTGSPWFVANWGVQVPLLPRECLKWLYWQYRVSEKAEEKGLYNALDLVLFNGAMAEFNALYGLDGSVPPTEPPTPPVPPPSNVFDPPADFVVKQTIYLRNAPGATTNKTVLGTIYGGKTIPVDERVLLGNDSWLRSGHLFIVEKVGGKVFSVKK